MKSEIGSNALQSLFDSNGNANGEKKETKFQKYLAKSLQAADEAKKKQAELDKRTKRK